MNNLLLIFFFSFFLSVESKRWEIDKTRGVNLYGYKISDDTTLQMLKKNPDKFYSYLKELSKHDKHSKEFKEANFLGEILQQLTERELFEIYQKAGVVSLDIDFSDLTKGFEQMAKNASLQSKVVLEDAKNQAKTMLQIAVEELHKLQKIIIYDFQQKAIEVQQKAESSIDSIRLQTTNFAQNNQFSIASSLSGLLFIYYNYSAILNWIPDILKILCPYFVIFFLPIFYNFISSEGTYLDAIKNVARLIDYRLSSIYKKSPNVELVKNYLSGSELSQMDGVNLYLTIDQLNAIRAAKSIEQRINILDLDFSKKKGIRFCLPQLRNFIKNPLDSSLLGSSVLEENGSIVSVYNHVQTVELNQKLLTEAVNKEFEERNTIDLVRTFIHILANIFQRIDVNSSEVSVHHDALDTIHFEENKDLALAIQITNPYIKIFIVAVFSLFIIYAFNPFDSMFFSRVISFIPRLN